MLVPSVFVKSTAQVQANATMKVESSLEDTIHLDHVAKMKTKPIIEEVVIFSNSDKDYHVHASLPAMQLLNLLISLLNHCH